MFSKKKGSILLYRLIGIFQIMGECLLISLIRTVSVKEANEICERILQREDKSEKVRLLLTGKHSAVHYSA